MSEAATEELEPSGSRLAERVLLTVRRRRQALLLAGAVCLLAGLVLGIVVAVSSGRGRAPTPADDRVAIYVTAIAKVHDTEVYVSDRLTAGERRLIERRGGRLVHFGPPPPGFAPVWFALGPLRLHGETAQLGWVDHCGSLCGGGGTYRLARQHGRWRIVARGAEWAA